MEFANAPIVSLPSFFVFFPPPKLLPVVLLYFGSLECKDCGKAVNPQQEQEKEKSQHDFKQVNFSGENG